MVAIFVIALTIRSVWEAEAGELAAVALALAYLTLRVVHAGVIVAAAGVEESVLTLTEHHSAGVAAAFWMQLLDAIAALAITTSVLTLVGIVTPRRASGSLGPSRSSSRRVTGRPRRRRPGC